MSGWSAEGSRYRGALAVLRILHEDGRNIREKDGLIGINTTGLLPGDMNLIRDLKPEMLAVLRRHPNPADWPRLLDEDPDWDSQMISDHQGAQQ